MIIFSYYAEVIIIEHIFVVFIQNVVVLIKKSKQNYNSPPRDN